MHQQMVQYKGPKTPEVMTAIKLKKDDTNLQVGPA